MRRSILVLCAVLWCAPGVLAQKRLKPGFNLFSKEQDIELGRQGAAEIEKKIKVVPSAEVTEWINRVGKKLSSSPAAGEYPYNFKVVVDPTINAFALPGGPMYIHTGLIAAADNEGQLAGVMAHEIAHVALRHGTNQVSKAQLLQLPAMLAGEMAQAKGGLWGVLGQMGVGVGANSLLLRFSRGAETDADILGTRLMSAAGYNPIEMAHFFEKLQGEGHRENMIAQFFSDHPNPGNRVKTVEKEIRYLPRGTYNAETGQFSRMKEMVSRMAPPPPPAKPRQ